MGKGLLLENERVLSSRDKGSSFRVGGGFLLEWEGVLPREERGKEKGDREMYFAISLFTRRQGK